MKKTIVNLLIIGSIVLYLIQHPIYITFEGYVVRIIHFLLIIYIVLIFFNDFLKYVITKTENKFSSFSLKARRKYRKIKNKK